MEREKRSEDNALRILVNLSRNLAYTAQLV